MRRQQLDTALAIGAHQMEPVYFACNTALANNWVETAQRDGLPVFTASDGSVRCDTSSGSFEVERHYDRKGQLLIAIEPLAEKTRSRLQSLLLASGACCNVPALYSMSDALYRCEHSVIEKWIIENELRPYPVFRITTRRNAAGYEFFDGVVVTPLGNTVGFTSGAAFDSTHEVACEFVELNIRTSWPITEMNRALIRDLGSRLERLGAVAIIQFGKIVE